MADGLAISMATIAITSTTGAFYQMLPPISQVREKSVDNPSFAADVRIGEVTAACIALGIGALTSSLSGSALPTIIAITAAAGMICLYESTLRSNRPFEEVSNV